MTLKRSGPPQRRTPLKSTSVLKRAPFKPAVPLPRVSPDGPPNRRIKYDQAAVREQIALVRSATCTIAEAARVVGCNSNYLGRRVWEETKRDVLVRDGACCRCGSRGALDAHHRRPRKAGGRPDPATSFGMANLIALCRPCHDHVERRRTEAYAQGFLIPGEVARPEETPLFRHLSVWVIPGDGVWLPSDPPKDVAA